MLLYHNLNGFFLKYVNCTEGSDYGRKDVFGPYLRGLFPRLFHFLVEYLFQITVKRAA